MPDIFSSISGIGAINASKSGKDLKGCIKTIEFVLRRFGKPKAIVIANNVNSLMNFPKENFSDDELRPKKQLSLAHKAKIILRKFIPGIYMLSAKTKSSLANKLKIPDYKKLPEYEKSLANGCCHGAASFNIRGGISFDWDSAKNRSRYYSHIRSVARTQIHSQADFYPLNRVVFFISNSYALKGTSGRDYRQLLTYRQKT